ncbi:MAG: hypothetical protein AB7V55_01930 [Oscillospiraceae bacterium]
MNAGASIVYDNGSEHIVFEKGGPLWLTAAPDLSSVEVEMAEVQSVGQAGSSLVGQSTRAKSIAFTGCIVGDVEASRARLLRVVAPGVTAKLTYHWGGKSYWLEGAPSRTPEIGGGGVLQDFQFVVRVPYPYWRDTELEAVQISAAPGASTLSNAGNVPAAFEVRFAASGSVLAPKLTFLDSGAHITVNHTLAAGDVFTVSTRQDERKVTYTPSGAAARNGFKYLGGNSELGLALAPGENRLQLSALNNPGNVRVTVSAPKGVYSGV